MNLGKRTRKSLIEQHKFNSNNDWKSIKRKSVKVLGVRLSKEIIQSVWDAYTKTFHEAVLSGKTFQLGICGEIAIFRSNLSDSPKAMKMMQVRSMSKRVMRNPKRFNHLYKITFLRKGVIHKKVKFVACKRTVSALSEILNTTNREYKPAPLINK